MSTRFSSLIPGISMSDRVSQAIGAEIRASRLVPGDRLPTEAELVQQFCVSRTVVREAVSRLKSLGLVETRQGSGAFVKSAGFSALQFDATSVVSRRAVVQMVEVRRALEAEVAALAAQRRTAADLRRIERAAVALNRAVQTGSDGVDADVALHRAIADAAHNPFLISTLDYLRQFLHGATRVTRANEARRADFSGQVRQEHDAIVEAIGASDAAKASQAAARHMNNAIKRIEQADPAFWRQQGVKLASPLLSKTPLP